MYNAVDKFRGELDEPPVQPINRGLLRCRAASLRRYFHCVETPKPAAMKPKPTTMFQLRIASIGIEPSVT